jgi:hypothetical protein
MTQEEIIKMAREAGLPLAWISEEGVLRWSEIERFAALVVQAERDASMRSFQRLAVTIAETEREACAKVCEQPGKQYRLGWECAAAIRARKD